MSARGTAREFLKAMGGDAAPEWRLVFSTDGTDEPTGIAPVCTDPDHYEDDAAEAYDCCPDPVIECDHHQIAAYLVALLNADRATETALAAIRTAAQGGDMDRVQRIVADHYADLRGAEDLPEFPAQHNGGQL